MKKYDYHYFTRSFCRYYSHQDSITSSLDFLHQQIEKIEGCSDKSLFFQDPRIIEGWLVLIKEIKETGNRFESGDDKNFSRRTDPYAAPLLTKRKLYLDFKKIYQEYYDQLKKLINLYDGWLEGDLISEDCREALIKDQYEKDLKLVDSFSLFIDNLNKSSRQARFEVYKTLKGIFDVLLAIMNQGGQIILDQNPSVNDFSEAIDNDMREWTKHNGKLMFKNMREELLRNFKIRLTDGNKYDLWCQMLRADEEALKMAMKQELSSCDDEKQDHWGEDMKAQMDKNGELIRLIYNSCYTDELIELGKVEILQPIIELLNPDNLSMFYDIILRRNLIQCEMYPELKTHHEEWLKGNRDSKQEEDETSGLDYDKRSKLDDIIQILQKGIWKLPATKENIVTLLNTLFGNNVSSLDDEDVPLCKQMWALVEMGRGDRKMIVSANLAGFFADENLLDGTPTDISKDLFGNNNMVNSINDGKKNNRSNAFEEVIPFLKKYTNKIIRQQ